MFDLKKLIPAVREAGVKNFEKHSFLTNEDKGKKMVVLSSKTLDSRKVNDWGRDEDNDMYIGLDENGWIKYKHTIQYLAGPVEISNPLTIRLSDEDVIRFLASEECTEEEYLAFMSKSEKLLNS